MMDKLDNNPENIDAIKFLEKLDDIFKKEISQEDINHIQNFCATGYFNKIITRVKLLEKEIKESIEYKIKELEDKIEKLQNEKEVLVVKIEDLKKDVKELGKKNTQLETDINKLQKDVTQLETDKNKLQKDVTQLETDKKKLQKDVGDLEGKITSLENDNKCFKKSLNQLINDNFSRGQETIDQKDILKNIKERDNYKSIIYMILISAGGSFDEIHKNIRASYFQLYNNINQDLDELYYEAKSFLNKVNNYAHSSSNSNIFKSLFPLYNEKYGSMFYDNIINKVKKLISDLNEPEEKQNKNELNRRKDEISKEIKKIFENFN